MNRYYPAPPPDVQDPQLFPNNSLAPHYYSCTSGLNYHFGLNAGLILAGWPPYNLGVIVIPSFPNPVHETGLGQLIWDLRRAPR